MISFEFLCPDSSTISTDTAEINALVRQLSSKPIENSPERVKRLVGSSHCVVARDTQANNCIVGMAFLSVKETLSGQTGEVDDVVVDEAYRDLGIGHALMERLIARGRSLCLKHLDLTSKPERLAANALYPKVGFERRQTNCYRLDLDSK